MFRASLIGSCSLALALGSGCVGEFTPDTWPASVTTASQGDGGVVDGPTAATRVCPSPGAHPSLSSDYDDRFTSLKTEADVIARRQEMVDTIWPCGGLPTTLPVVTEHAVADVGAAVPANLTNLAPTVLQLDFPELNPMPPNNNDGGTGMAFLLTPLEAPRHRVVVLNAGHASTFDETEQGSGMANVVQTLLTENYSVLLMYMPHFTPTDSTGAAADGVGNHDFMFSDGADAGGGNPVDATNYHYFLEPSVVAINYLVSDAAPGGAFTDIALAGLSGGGWTTAMVAAIDTRPRLSVVVSGIIPGYVEVALTYDAEQYIRSRLGVGDADLHVMAADGAALGGAPRRQTHVFNRRDDCCFGESQYDNHDGALGTWQSSMRLLEGNVRAALFGIGSTGRYRLEVDEMADHHMISANSLQNILLAELDDDRKLVGASNSNGDLFYRGVNGNLFRRTFPIDGESVENDTGVAIAGVASVAEGGPHAIDVFARDSTTGWGENNLIHYYLPDAEAAWVRETLPAFMMSDPGVVAGDGVVDVVNIGPDGSIYDWSSATQTQQILNTNGFFGPPAAVRFQGALHIFARGHDSSTYHLSQSASAGWVAQPMPLVLSGFPTAATCGQLICISGLGTDTKARIGTLDASGAWSGWSVLPVMAGLRGTPSMGSTGGAGVPLYISTDRGTLGRFLQASDGGPWAFTDLQDVTVASPTAIQMMGGAQPGGTASMSGDVPSGTGGQSGAGGQAGGTQPMDGASMTGGPSATGAVISGGQSGALWIHRGATARLGGWFD